MHLKALQMNLYIKLYKVLKNILMISNFNIVSIIELYNLYK